MKFAQILVLYGLLGIGCVGALLRQKGRAARPIDLLLTLVAWPLLAPFMLLHKESDDLLEPLRADTPLASLLPDPDTGRRLQERLDLAARRIEEIDGLLTQPDYDLGRVHARHQALLETGNTEAAAMIEQRAGLIRRLRSLRNRFSQEIEQITELLTQLKLQAEVVRIAGSSDSDTQSLLHELVSRIQGLESFLEADWELSG